MLRIASRAKASIRALPADAETARQQCVGIDNPQTISAGFPSSSRGRPCSILARMECPDPPSTAPSSRPSAAVQAWRRYDDDERRLSAHVSERMLDLAGLRPGSRVLDIATGRGEPALRAAARVAPDGVVLGTDISDEMLDFARARASAESVPNLHLQVTDGETLAGVPEHAFDAALCRWGLMYFPRPRQALQSIRRRLRPEGRFVAAACAAPEDVAWWSLPRDVLARQVPLPALDPTAPGPFRHADAAAFRADLSDAGFSVDHEEARATAVMESATPEGLVDWCLAFGLSRLLADLPESVAATWRRDMRAERSAAARPTGCTGWAA